MLVSGAEPTPDFRSPCCWGRCAATGWAREPRGWSSDELERRGHAVHLVDPLELQLPLLDRMYKEYPAGEAPETLERLAALYRGADGFLVVSGEYNHGIPPALKNLLDHFLEEYFWRPSGIVCYSAGAFGGVRAAMQLRMTLAELGMPSVPSLLPIPRIAEAIRRGWRCQRADLRPLGEPLPRRVPMVRQRAAQARAAGTPY